MGAACNFFSGVERPIFGVLAEDWDTLFIQCEGEFWGNVMGVAKLSFGHYELN